MKKLLFTLLFSGLLVSCGNTGSEKELSMLKEGFDNPPNEARTRVWWHWMNGNITKDGIKKDLEWMDRIGLGGFQHFDAALGTPTIVDKRLIYMDEGWKDAFAYATELADSLGLEMAVASAPGWSSTGGPWVSPQDAMKKLVWRTMMVEGGSKVNAQLPEPYKITGAFQNGAPAGRGAANMQYEYYEDIVTLAVKVPANNISMVEQGVKMSTSGGNFTLEQLTDGDIANSSMLPNRANGPAWILFEYPEATTIRSVTMVGASGASLESSNDGKNFVTVCDLRGGRTTQSTITVPATTAKYFKVVVPAPRPQGSMFGFGGGSGPAPKGTAIAELDLHSYTRVNRAEDKAAYSSSAKLALTPTPASEGEVFPSIEDVVDITAMVDKNGKISWDAPEGRWKIYRFGWSLTGKQNHPAPPEATGLEVDKLDPDAWTRFFHKYFEMYKDASDGLMGAKGLQYVLTDSYEAEHQTWTPAMFEEFEARRGYDMLKWMPVLAGEVIGSPEQSDKFLWDWRMNIGDLYAANYDLLTKIAKEDFGLLGRYTESHEAGRAFMGDGMDVKRTAQVPMSAMWCSAPWLGRTPDGDYNRNVYMADCRESASVAHIYGQNIAAAESMTAWGNSSAYSYCPENLKFVADIELANGINRFVIHESAHQPSDVFVPGLSLGGIGQWFNRHDTWAEMAYVWADYMARSCYMLQAGKNVADILYYYGEDNSVCSEFGMLTGMPQGYEWDYCSPHALMNAVQPKKGKLVSQGGTQYELLLMDRNMDYVSVAVLRRVAELADAGVVISAVKPKYAASLADNKEEFDALVKDIFESGRKNVYVDTPLEEVLKSEGITPDVILDEDMKYLHRTMANTEIYWINKPAKDYRNVEVSFRTSGKRPQLWHPDSGIIEEVSYRVDGDRTIVSLELVPDDAVFVVFNGAAENSYSAPQTKSETLLTVDSSWTVKFQEHRGAPAQRVFEKLESYTESDEFGVKHFSGIASYNNTINVDIIEGKAILDLGSVKNIAEVFVNGEYCGTAWKEPFRVDVSSALKAGENQIEIKVANLWVNRLIGDEQPNCPEKIAYTDSRAYTAKDALVPAGLLGPVKLINEK